MARVKVSLNSVQRVTYTDVKGRFLFPKLSARSYKVSAQYSGYLGASFGERQPGRSGVAFALRDDQRIDDITLTLHKGGVVGERVIDQDGRPMMGIIVSPLLMRWRSDGAREFVATLANMTDDRGEYRLFGLPPGTYLLAAIPPIISGVPALERAVELDRVQLSRRMATSRHIFPVSRPREMPV